MSADREALPLLGRANGPHAASRKSRSKRLVVVIACGFLVFGAQFGTYLTIPSQTAIFEEIICRKYLQSHGPWDSLPDASPNGDFCKSEEVQGELALVIGYKDGLDMIPGRRKPRDQKWDIPPRRLILGCWASHPPLASLWNTRRSLGATTCDPPLYIGLSTERIVASSHT